MPSLSVFSREEVAWTEFDMQRLSDPDAGETSFFA